MDVNIFWKFHIFCVRNRRYESFMRKMTKTSLRNQQIPVCNLPKNLHIFLCIFYNRCVWADIFNVKWIFLRVSMFFYMFLNTPIAFMDTSLFRFFLGLRSQMTSQIHRQHPERCAVKIIFLQCLAGGRNFNGSQVIAKSADQCRCIDCCGPQREELLDVTDMLPKLIRCSIWYHNYWENPKLS